MYQYVFVFLSCHVPFDMPFVRQECEDHKEKERKKNKNKMCVFYNIRENNPTLGLHHLQKKKKKPDTERVKYYYRNA